MDSYIMFMFGEHKEQDEFIENIASELSLISDSNNIKFYYGNSSAIFTFKSHEKMGEIDEFMNIIFGETNIIYFILPLVNDNMSVKLPEDVYNHLFDINNGETMSGFTVKAQELINNIPDLINESDFINFSDEDDDEDYEIVKLKNKKSEPSIDEILDKISELGINSLNSEEKNILEKFSKSI